MRDVFLAFAVESDEPQLHVVDVVERRVAVARDAIVPADGHAERLRDFLDIDPEVGRALAVDLDEQFRLVQPQRGVRIDNAGDLPDGRAGGIPLALLAGRRRCLEFRRLAPPPQLLGVLGQLVEVGAHDGEIDIDRRALPERCLIADGDSQVRILRQALADLLHLFALREIAGECGPGAAGQRIPPQPPERKHAPLHFSQPDVDRGRVDPRCADRR